MIAIARVYEAPGGRGRRFLVDRLWPRGVKKEALKIEAWVKEAAPSSELRKWSHESSNFDEFRRRYYAELDRNPESWRPILEAARRGAVTLLYAARDTEHNNAVVLQEYLEKKLAHTKAS
jgi:uncharacterized protein YeaO (DUF488 family)